MESPRSSRRAVVALVAVLTAFIMALGFIVAGSLAPRRLVEFSLTVHVPRSAIPDSLVWDTVTVDAAAEDRWRFFDFATGVPVEPPNTVGWDLAFSRFRVVPADAALDLGPVAFATVHWAPSEGFIATAYESDTTNAAMSRWYRYDFFSHLLRPNGHVYVVRTSDGHYAKLEFLSYYCIGTLPGCITFRYAYQGNGSRRFD